MFHSCDSASSVELLSVTLFADMFLNISALLSDVTDQDELKLRRDFVADRRRDDVTMTSQQALLPDDMSNMTSLCADNDDVSVCLQMVGSRSVYLLTYCFLNYRSQESLYSAQTE